MKAHTVKCQICAPGVHIVSFQEHDSKQVNVAVVSAYMTPDEALDFVATHIAIQRTREAEGLGQQVVYTSDEIKAGHVWNVQTTKILSHK